ncbi:MAG: CsgG/HfaB family protein, partial [Gemmatimonadaceae bacterium]
MRVSRFRTVLSTTVLLAGVLAVSVRLPAQESSKSDTRPTVAVLYLTNGAMLDNATYAPLSKGIAEMLITELAQNNAVRVVERDRLQTVLEEQNLQGSDRVDKETAVKLGKILGSRHMLMGSFVIDLNKNMRIDVRAVNTETSSIEYVETITGKSDKLLELVIQLGAKINSGLKLPALKLASATVPAAKSPNQFKALLAMSRALEAEDSKDIAGAREHYK